MREILFRGKRADNGEWLVGYLVGPFTNWKTHCIVQELGGDSWTVDPATVGQYTGLKDKNGTKIFEGDIFGFDDESDWFYIVTWKPAVFGYTVNKGIKTGSAVYSFDREQLNLIEVTGNIHERAKP